MNINHCEYIGYSCPPPGNLEEEMETLVVTCLGDSSECPTKSRRKETEEKWRLYRGGRRRFF